MVDLVELAHEDVTFDGNFLFLSQLRGYGHPGLPHGRLLSQRLRVPGFLAEKEVSSPELYCDGALHLLAATRVHHSQSSAATWAEVRQAISLLDF